MKCPRTGEPLVPVKVGGITVDVSQGCGGVFFDNFELAKFDEAHEVRGEVLVGHLEQFNRSLLDDQQRLKCPKCVDAAMLRRYYSPKRQIEIDECVACGGVWLDPGELARLRELFPSQKDREATSTQFMQEFLQSPEYLKHREEHEQLIRKMNKITNFLWAILGVRRR